MKCLECGSTLERIDTDHLAACSGLTLQEYAIRHRLPLDLLLTPDQVEASHHPVTGPAPARCPSDQARAVMQGLRLAGRVAEQDGLTLVAGEIRTLELLLWDLCWLREYGFCFRQDYGYGDQAHRVVARNRLCAPTSHVRRAEALAAGPLPPPDPLDVLAVCVAHGASLQCGYLFLEVPADEAGAVPASPGVGFVQLPDACGPDRVLLRTATVADTDRLLALLGSRLAAMPGVAERFAARGPCATVVKELVFDAAHFITDHPAKCSNLHGGRYVLHVKVHDRIDPVTGCVVDYGYLKRTVNRRVIERFDHHTLNYAAPELAWRSSTEMLCVFIWEQLIDCLPGLQELQLFETTQSWCSYTGPTLAEFQRRGPSALHGHFTDPALGTSGLRRLIGAQRTPALRAVDQR